MDALREELEDRYGPLPEEVERLLDYMRVRRLAEGILVESMERDRQGIAITFHHRTPIPPHKLVETVSSVPGLSVSPEGQLRLRSAGVSTGRCFPRCERCWASWLPEDTPVRQAA